MVEVAEDSEMNVNKHDLKNIGFKKINERGAKAGKGEKPTIIHKQMTQTRHRII